MSNSTITAKLPASALTDSDFGGQAGNNAASPLTAAMSNNQLTVPVAELANYPSEGTVWVGTERIHYTSKSASSGAGNLVLTDISGRGYDGSAAQAQVQGSIVMLAITALERNRMRVELEAIGNILTGVSPFLHGLIIKPAAAETALTLDLQDQVGATGAKLIALQVAGVEKANISWDAALSEIQFNGITLEIGPNADLALDDGRSVYFGTAHDLRLTRQAASVLEVTGASAGSVRYGMSGAASPFVELRLATADANPAAQLLKDRLSFGPGGAGSLDWSMVRQAAGVMAIQDGQRIGWGTSASITQWFTANPSGGYFTNADGSLTIPPGVSDLAAALTSAASAIGAAGGTIIVTPGAYNSATTFAWSTNSRLRIVGQGVTVTPATGTTFIRINQGSGATATGAGIEGFLINAGANANVTAIELRDTDRAFIRNVRILNCAVGILYNSTNLGGSAQWVEQSVLEDVFIWTCTTGVQFKVASGTGSFGETSWRNVGISGCTTNIDLGNTAVGAVANVYGSDWHDVKLWNTGAQIAFLVNGDLTGARLNIAIESFGGGPTAVSIGSNAVTTAADLRLTLTGTFGTIVNDPNNKTLLYQANGVDRYASGNTRGFRLWGVGNANPSVEIGYQFAGGGGLIFGPGNITGDIQLFRQAAGQLQTNATLIAQVAGGYNFTAQSNSAANKRTRISFNTGAVPSETYSILTDRNVNNTQDWGLWDNIAAKMVFWFDTNSNFNLGGGGAILMGSGGDLTLARQASSIIEQTGALAGSVRFGMSGAATPFLALRAASGDANHTAALLKDRVEIGAGGASAADVDVRRTGANAVQITASSGITITGSLAANADNTLKSGSAAIRWSSVNAAQMNVYGAASDANPRTRLGNALIGFGPGGATALRTYLFEQAAGVVAASTNGSTVDGTLYMRTLTLKNQGAGPDPIINSNAGDQRIELTGHFVPNNDNTFAIGTATGRWQSVSVSNAFRVYQSIGDANTITTLDTAGLKLGAGGATALDVTLARNASSELILTGALAGDVRIGMTGAATPHLSLRLATADANHAAALNKDRVELGAGGASAVDVDLRRTGTNALQLTASSGITVTGDLLASGSRALGSAGTPFNFLYGTTASIGALQPGVAAKSANYVILDTDGLLAILVTTGAGGVTITLPSAATKRMILIKKVDNGAGSLTIARAGADTIDGATSITTAAQYNAYTLVSDGGTAWGVF